MHAHRSATPLVTGTLLASACAAWLIAGPINPPSGPVTSGGKTTQEIYDAVTANSLATGAIGSRGPAVPGATFSAGTIQFMPGVSGAILGMRLSVSSTPTFSNGTLTASQPIFNSLTIIRDMSSGDGVLWRYLVQSRLETNTATITIPCSGGNMVYSLASWIITGQRHMNIQRADGTFAAIEEFDVTVSSLRVTDPSGTTYQYNFATKVASP